jgi:arginine/ornithine N-succinyltransferase beta subunit
MPFRVRPARADDFQAIYEMAKLTGGGFTNLPPDKGALVEKLARSQAAFAKAGDEPGDDMYLFVLEDPEAGLVRGTCQIFSMVGQRQPFYSYRISALTQHSPELGRTFRAEMLSLTTDFEGASEVGGLFLHPLERAGGPRHAAGPQPLSVHQAPPRTLRHPAARGAARRDRRERRLAILGRDRRPLLRHGLPGANAFNG